MSAVVDLPALRHAALTVLTWSDRTPRCAPDWIALADAIRSLRAAAGHGRLGRILETLSQGTRTPDQVDDALRDLADLLALPRPHRTARARQLQLPL
ncbi:MAG: hypothetical protein ACRDWD_15940 [Acidimicrobiia bacterium]